MTKQEAYELIDAYEAAPNGFTTCDNLCTVADALDLDEGEYQPDDLREMVDEQLEDESDEEESIEDAGPAGTRQANKLREDNDEYCEEPDHDDTVHCCPDCERPNQFGELCAECERELKAEAEADSDAA